MATSDDELMAAFSENESRLKRFLAGRTRSHHDSEDLSQEAWIKLARNGGAALAAPVPYLMSIARTLAVDHSRGQKHRLTSHDIDDLMSVPDGRPGPEKEAAMISAMISRPTSASRTCLTATISALCLPWRFRPPVGLFEPA